MTTLNERIKDILGDYETTNRDQLNALLAHLIELGLYTPDPLPDLVIEVRGGCCVGVSANPLTTVRRLSYCIVDYDDLREEGAEPAFDVGSFVPLNLW